MKLKQEEAKKPGRPQTPGSCSPAFLWPWEGTRAPILGIRAWQLTGLRDPSCPPTCRAAETRDPGVLTARCRPLRVLVKLGGCLT